MTGIRPGPLAARLLQTVLDVYEEAGVELPERQYLAPGPLAAWDGPHLAVCLSGTLPGGSDATSRPGGLPGKAAGAMTFPRGVYEARILRCVPVLDDDGNAPSAEEITASAEELLVDCGLLLDAGYRWVAQEHPTIMCTVGQSTPLGPDGQLGGYSVQITASPMQ